MDWYTVEKMAAYNQSDLESELTARRVRIEIMQGQAQTPTTYDHALANLGRWLVDRGKKMEERHSRCIAAVAPKLPVVSHHV